MRTKGEQSLEDTLKIREKFIPKHLSLHTANKKHKANKQFFYQQTTAEKAQKYKRTQLRPIQDIEKIMRHFHTKFDGHMPRISPRKRKNLTSMDTPNNITEKIQSLLSLPVIRQAKVQCKKYQDVVSIDLRDQRNVRRKKLLTEFDSYIHDEMQPY